MVAIAHRYTRRELDCRTLFKARVTSIQDVGRFGIIYLPWSRRSAKTVLSPEAFSRLQGAFDYVRVSAEPKRVLIVEDDYLWSVTIVPNPDKAGYRLVWRYICSE